MSLNLKYCCSKDFCEKRKWLIMFCRDIQYTLLATYQAQSLNQACVFYHSIYRLAARDWVLMRSVLCVLFLSFNKLLYNYQSVQLCVDCCFLITSSVISWHDLRKNSRSEIFYSSLRWYLIHCWARAASDPKYESVRADWGSFVWCILWLLWWCDCDKMMWFVKILGGSSC